MTIDRGLDGVLPEFPPFVVEIIEICCVRKVDGNLREFLRESKQPAE